jgi:hypothetical protein
MIKNLTQANFLKAKAGSTQILTVNIKGPLLVFFRLSADPNCKEFEPVFAELSKVEGRVAYGSLDLKAYRDVGVASKETNTPINSVPILILYIDGYPKAKYNGTRNITSIRNFISQMFKPQQQQSQQQNQQQQFMTPLQNDPQGGSQNMYGGYSSPQQSLAMRPEMGPVPRSAIKMGGKHAYGPGIVEDEEEPRMAIPDNVIPYNTPWEADEKM